MKQFNSLCVFHSWVVPPFPNEDEAFRILDQVYSGRDMMKSPMSIVEIDKRLVELRLKDRADELRTAARIRRYICAICGKEATHSEVNAELFGAE